MIDNIQGYAEKYREEFNLPAVSLALWKDGQLHCGAAGCLNLDTGVEATNDSIFQIGSITKVLTTCLVLKLVEQGRLNLDFPVKKYLRSFHLADADAAEIITVRQLLNHSNGLAGDYFPDDVNEDAPHIARYVDRVAQLPLVHPVGERFSYSNSAFAIVGRLVEVVSGISWYDAIEEWIFQPLGMCHAICRPTDMIRFRTALGHIEDSNLDSQWKTCTGRFITLGQAPAGTTITMTAAELITFGRAHLDLGIAENGQRWLSQESIRLMQKPSIDVPLPSSAVKTAIGLGWFCYETLKGDQTFIDHGGATNGQLATLRVFPNHNTIIAVLTNCNDRNALASIVNELTLGSSGIDCTEPPLQQKKYTARQLKALVGRYCAYAGACTISFEDGELIVLLEDYIIERAPVEAVLCPIDILSYELRTKTGVSAGRLRFLEINSQGCPAFLFYGMRLYTRV